MSPEGMAGPWDTTMWWSIFTWTHGLLSAQLCGWITVIFAIGYTMGRHAKLCAAALLILLTSMYFRNWYASNAEDTMFRMYMYYSLFLPIGGAAEKSPKIWSARMVQIHIALIYLISTLTKWMNDEAWRNGDAMYYVIIDPLWSRWPWPWMFYHQWVTKLTTYGSLFAEGSFAFIVWIPQLRKYIICEMIVFHILLVLALQHTSFFALSMIPGLLLFLTEAEIRSISTWATSRIALVTSKILPTNSETNQS